MMRKMTKRQKKILIKLEANEEKRTPLPIPVPTTPPPEFMRPTAKRLPAPQTPQEQPQAPQAQASSSSSSSGAPNQPKDASETERLTKAVRDLSEQWDRELAEGIQAGEKAADELKQLETTESAQPKRKKVVFQDQDQNQTGTDLIPAEPLTDVPPDLEPEKNKPVCETMVPSLDEIKKLYGQRISKGVTASIQTGPRLRMLQELFGDPSGIRIHLAVVAKRPKASEAPEPLLSREYAPMLQELILHKDKSKWMKTPWKKYSTTFYSQPPLWVIYLYGSKKVADEPIGNPWQELADMQVEVMKPLSSLPKFLQALTNGTKEEKTALILGLHRRMYHKEGAELRKLLNAAGVPMHILSIVDEALVGCEVCRNFQQVSAKPLTKLSTAFTFNDTAYFS